MPHKKLIKTSNKEILKQIKSFLLATPQDRQTDRQTGSMKLGLDAAECYACLGPICKFEWPKSWPDIYVLISLSLALGLCLPFARHARASTVLLRNLLAIFEQQMPTRFAPSLESSSIQSNPHSSRQLAIDRQRPAIHIELWKGQLLWITRFNGMSGLITVLQPRRVAKHYSYAPWARLRLPEQAKAKLGAACHYR